MIQHSEKPGHYLFANLAAFSITGGMEKFNRSFLHALYNLEQKGVLTADAVSLCDTGADEAYFPNTKYHGYGLNRLKFVWGL